MISTTPTFANEGAKAVAAALDKTNVTVLLIDENQGITDDGAVAIFAALPAARVKSIYVYNIGITDEGAMAIAEMLPQTGLTELTGHRCDALTAKGVATLNAAVAANGIAAYWPGIRGFGGMNE